MERSKPQVNIGDQFVATDITPVEFTNFSDHEKALTWLVPWMRVEIVSTINHKVLGVLAKVKAWDPNKEATLRVDGHYVPITEFAKLSKVEKADETEEKADVAV
ncbi:MAG: hypothetical protein WC873_01475 [Candidatus Gracilibacteria bacterium]